ncbi:hypothetical protein SZN_23326 [Streptomyces zinciresistens K42]|uniref:Integral membrane protein n=1 Tax=Streptomyces zinciresistens K42 TaxID=700597 RepID=G2GGN1_9ACTN|nr:hypothetical protein [Streptomyces zinciresistens]EGX57326.1 hypothetical protein SZN_23326 [Streptomyces zinciresistens K42]
MVSSPTDPQPAPAVVPTRIIVRALASFPLYFVVMFSVCYISAFHAPRPNGLHLVVAGPASAAGPVVRALDASDPGAFDIVTAPGAAEARALLETREAAGAVVVGEGVTVLVAGGGGAPVRAAVTEIGTAVAQRAGLTPVIEDVSPLPRGDSTGTGIFYLLIVSSMAGYLTSTILTQAAAHLRLRTKYAVVAGAAVAGPLIAFAIGSAFLGTYGLGAGGVAQLLGVLAAYTFLCGALGLLSHQLLGANAMMLVMALVVFLNFPSAGGAIPVGMLPDFWQWVHSVWFGSGALEALRSIVYFDGHGAGGPLLRLGLWTVLAAALSAALARRAARAPAPDPRDEPLVEGGVPAV